MYYKFIVRIKIPKFNKNHDACEATQICGFCVHSVVNGSMSEFSPCLMYWCAPLSPPGCGGHGEKRSGRGETEKGRIGWGEKRCGRGVSCFVGNTYRVFLVHMSRGIPRFICITKTCYVWVPGFYEFSLGKIVESWNSYVPCFFNTYDSWDSTIHMYQKNMVHMNRGTRLGFLDS